MAYTTIKDPSAYFQTKLYTGGTAEAKTFDGNSNLKPDWFWSKKRGASESHQTADSVRGIANSLRTDSTIAEYTNSETDDLASFDTNGFTFNGTGDTYNGTTTSSDYVAWCWKAGTTASGNTGGSGTYKTYSSSSNSTAGFSIVKYTGNGTAGHTIPHGCGSAPSMVIFKQLNATRGWGVYHKDLGVDKIIYLDENIAPQTASPNTRFLNNTAPSSSVVTLGTWNEVNINDASYIAYCFADVQGYSKFGSYVAGSDTTAKPNNDGTFIYTGFKPRFIMTKRTDGTSDWCIFDTVRSTLNPMYNILFPNKTNAENTSEPIDVYSNGWKPRADSGLFNYPAGSSWIYYAIAEEPLVGDNPATAR